LPWAQPPSSQKEDDSALADLDALDQEDGKPHIVKRVDNPRINVIPELVGKGALPSSEL
jgi:hypothetical protein